MADQTWREQRSEGNDAAIGADGAALTNRPAKNVAALADESTNVDHWTADLSLCAMAAIRSITCR